MLYFVVVIAVFMEKIRCCYPQYLDMLLLCCGGDQLKLSSVLKHVIALMVDETNWHCPQYLHTLLLWWWKRPIDIVGSTWRYYCSEGGGNQLTLSAGLGFVLLWWWRRPGGTVRITWMCYCSDDGGDQLTLSSVIECIIALMVYETNWHCQQYLEMLLLWWWRRPVDSVSRTWSCYCSDGAGNHVALSAELGHIIVLMEETNRHCQQHLDMLLLWLWRRPVSTLSR